MKRRSQLKQSFYPKCFTIMAAFMFFITIGGTPKTAFAQSPAVDVFFTSTINLALGGTATQSSTRAGGVASRAIDNNDDGRYRNRSVTHTTDSPNSWWQVELEFDSRISNIQLFNRTDNCCIGRLSDFTVEVLNNNGGVVWSQFFSSPTFPTLSVIDFTEMGMNIAGKTVRVSRDGVLSLAEVAVNGTEFTTPTLNLALTGVASQSSTRFGASASRAIDNDPNGQFRNRSVTHTAPGNNVWWEVDLKEVSSIVSVEIFNRTDCCPERLTDYTVTLLDEFGDVTSSRFPYTTDFSTIIHYSSITAKKVRISMATGEPLSLAEVRVFGTPNVAQNGTASQSSTAFGGVASRAIDDDARANYSSGTTTHTRTENNAWWQVELAETTDITQINIHNRIDDCCFARLGDFTVSVLDQNGNVVYSEFFEGGRVFASLPIRFRASGKTVRVNLPQGPLSLAEVRVFGTPQ